MCEKFFYRNLGIFFDQEIQVKHLDKENSGKKFRYRNLLKIFKKLRSRDFLHKYIFGKEI